MSLIATALLALGLPSFHANADTPGCSLATHCYSDLWGTGTAFDGMTGTWNRAYMSTTGSATNQYFMDSEMWFVNSYPNYWVEEGIFQGYEPNIKKLAYEIFYGWNTVNNSYGYTPIAYTSPNDSTTDSYQISHSSTSGIFNVWFNGGVYNTPNTGFLQSDHLQMGAEVATPVGHAHTFNMYSSGIIGSQTQNWGTQSASFIPTSIRGTVLNGVHNQNSEWSWNTVQP